MKRILRAVGVVAVVWGCIVGATLAVWFIGKAFGAGVLLIVALGFLFAFCVSLAMEEE